MLDRVFTRIFRAQLFRSRLEDTNMSKPDDVVESFTNDPDFDSESTAELDNSRQVLIKMATLYAEKLLNDICLIVGGVEYPAHRLILCVNSDVFQVMLMNNHWSESRENIIELKETADCAAVFGDFLQYFYTGRIKINRTIAMPILELADKYNVKDLVTLCVDYMVNHVAAASTQIISWFQYTFSLGHVKLAQACFNFIKWNFQLVSTTIDFGNCTPEVFTRILQDNDVVIDSELSIFRCVDYWLTMQRQKLYDSGESNTELIMNNLIQEIVCQIRFPMMSPRQLAELIRFPLVQQYNEHFMHRMAIAMHFHSGFLAQSKEEFDDIISLYGRRIFTPRLYTSDKWSTTMLIDHFSNFEYYQASTAFFTTSTGFAEQENKLNKDKSCEWIFDVYPKGMWFQKFLLIVWQGTETIPERVEKIVRVAITCKDLPIEVIKVKIGIIVHGTQENVEHVITAVEKNYYFSKDDRVFNIDDAIPFDSLTMYSSNGSDFKSKSPFLIGENRDTFKIQIVVAPMTDYSNIELPLPIS